MKAINMRLFFYGSCSLILMLIRIESKYGPKRGIVLVLTEAYLL